AQHRRSADSKRGLHGTRCALQIPVMRSNPHFDFSHLTVAERIQLAEDLWESIEPSVEELPLPPELAAERDRRMAELAVHPARAARCTARPAPALSVRDVLPGTRRCNPGRRLYAHAARPASVAGTPPMSRRRTSG